MTYISSNWARILTALGMLLFFAGPLRADPVVAITSGGMGGIPIMNIDAATFLGQINANGTLTVVITNANPTLTFQDFHFLTMNLQSAPWVGNVNPIFGDFSSDNFSIDFVVGGSGVGLAPGASFTVTFTGFLPNSQVRGIATVPEPATLFLLGTGVAGIAFKMRKRFSRRRDSIASQR